MQHKAVYLLFCKFALHVLWCQPHPSSGIHKTVTRASATGHMFVQLLPSIVAKRGHDRRS